MSLHLRFVRAAFGVAVVLGAPELLGMPGSAVACAAEDWRWSITPYLWGSSIATDVRFPAGQEVGGELDFDDLLDKLDIAAQAHVEGHREKWGFFVDATYLSTSDEGARGPIAAETDVDTGLYEIAGVYTPGGADGRFSAFVGARMMDISLDMTFTGAGPVGSVERRSTDANLTDFMVGGRYVLPLNESWFLNLRGDVGSGDSESSWNAVAMVGWRFTADRGNAVLLGWRHMEIEIESNGVQTDLTMDGPFAGVMFGF